MVFLPDTGIDFLLVSWITGSIALLSMFVRYGIKTWLARSFGEMYNSLTFFNGLIIHHIGNLILLIWFWLKVHEKEVIIPTNRMDLWILIIGTTIACVGVFYKVRMFSYSLTEVALTVVMTLLLSAISVFVVPDLMNLY